MVFPLLPATNVLRHLVCDGVIYRLFHFGKDQSADGEPRRDPGK